MKRTISRCLAGALAAVFVMTSRGPVQAAGPDLWRTAPEAGISVTEDPGPEIPEEKEVTEIPEVPEPEEPEAETPEAPEPPETETPKTPEPEEPKARETTGDQEPAAQSAGQDQMAGAVEVQITAGVPVHADQEFLVELKGAEPASQKAVLKPAPEDALFAPQVFVRFPELKAGSYELRVSGSGYAAYTQTIQVDGLAYRIQLYTGEAVVGTEQAKPGLLAGGDLNGDGKLDGKDTDLLIDAIDAGRYQESYDLYGDGVVDLKDLNHLTRLMGNQAKATPEKFIPLEAADVTLMKGTLSSGSDSDRFLRGESGLLLSFGGDGAELTFDFGRYAEAPVMEEILIGAPKDSGHAITEGGIAIDTADGRQLYGAITGGASLSQVAAVERNFDVKVHADGSVSVDLKGQIAVKRITLRITKTADAGNLAEISSVRFVNDMESRIPEPEMNIPKNVKAVPGNKSFTVTWDRQNNVTAYELRIVSEGGTDLRRTTAVSMDVRQFQGGKLKNDTVYEVQVQSLNGEWKSGYSGVCAVTPKADRKPPAPEGIQVTGGYRYLDVRWKNMEDTDSYRLFYKEDGTDQYEEIRDLSGTYCRITGLKDDTRYVLYLTGINDLGEGPASRTASGRTISGLIPAKLPEYKLINTSNGEGKLSAHIVSAVIGGGSVSMADSPLDTEADSALGAFDNRYASYIDRQDWDYGGAYPGAGKGVTVQFDQTYEIGMITLAQPMDEGNFTYVNVQYWDESGKRQTADGVSIVRRRSNNRNWYLIKFKEPLKTSKLQLGIGHQYGYYKVAISEIRFHEYDSLEQDILGLYADDLYITLRDGVDQKTIDALQARLDTPDPASGEYHPEREALQEELDAAKALLNTKGLGNVIQVNADVTAWKDQGISVGGLMARQPLGVTAAAGDRLVVYVGNPGMKSGTKTQNLDLVFTQQHAEAGGLSQKVTLSVGRNEITVPAFFSTDVEKGGPLYIQYRGNNPKDQYAVRVSGGTAFPVLNLYHVSDEAERARRIRTYTEELKDYTEALSQTHEEDHNNSENESVNRYVYNERTCILNTTDIVTDYMMLSVPASQVQAGLGTDAVGRMTDTLKAMDRMLLLFYQHKGLTDSFADGTSGELIERNHLPYECLNIRYMTMFDGAFMYAAGDHIGIEWGSVPGLMGGVPVQADGDGRYQSGNYFGWGIAHEIGHQINQGAYAHAEVTNNYYSVLAQAKDTNESVRFQYPEVFRKVTSGTTGYSDNVFTQLGLYWQLHLAYDGDYNYKTYGTWQEIQEHLFFARVDRYARETSAAPSPKGVKLTLEGGRDQNLMRLASAAAERDLTEFFTRWGMTPDAGTRSYMEQFEKEERAIYYVDDAARVYQMTKGAGSSRPAKPSAKVEDSPLGTVTLTMASSVPEDIQGYEITRVFTEWGKERRETAGFTQSGTFKDHAAFAAGHVITYEIRAVDKWLNYSEAYRTAPVKIRGSGILDKSSQTVETNLISKDDDIIEDEETLPCEKVVRSAITCVINGKYDDLYTGAVTGQDPYIILKLGKVEGVAAVQYVCESGTQIGAYRIEVSTDGENYQKAAEGNFTLRDSNARVDFTDENQRLCTYDAAFVKLTAVGQAGKELSITELDLYGPSGDNVEISSAGIGTLSADYAYDKEDPSERIPKGSIVFTGEYKGNPAYNVVVLYDENGKIVGGTDQEGTLIAHQIILMNPLKDDDAQIGNVADGKWIYWFEPSDPVKAADLPRRVRAELYRVDDALTNEGQRLVSDTAFVKVPESLPSVTLTSGQ